MGQVTESGTVVFKPRARLLHLIGAELISDDVVAVTELVKNASDADASTVTMTFEEVTEDEGMIEVSDDGCGMDLDTLLHRWMEPASSAKADPQRQRTPSGRRVLGEKGVGRFAVDRLGAKLELISRCPDSDTELRAVFDWDRFRNEEVYLSDVENFWEVRPARTIEKHGTVLRITGLRRRWNERMFRRLSMRLSRLISPSVGDLEFNIVIDSDEFPDYSGALRQDLLERSPYRIEATFNGRHEVRVSLDGGEPVSHLWNGRGRLTCGPVKVSIYAFDLETQALSSIGPRVEVRAWLREWSGISIYRDGFRVWPYGEPHDDWLRLDQRRVNNPVVRLSNNQVVGFIDIAADNNPELRDQTNREGLDHNRAFDDLRRLMVYVLRVLEAKRQSRRRLLPRREVWKSDVPSQAEALLTGLDVLINRAPPELERQALLLRNSLKENLEREAIRQRQMLMVYSALASLGQASITLSEDLSPLFGELSSEITDLRAKLRGPGSRESRDRMKRIERNVESINRRMEMIAPMKPATRRRKRTIDVPGETSAFRELMLPLLDGHGVEMRVHTTPGEIIRAEVQPDVYQRVLHILMSNSLDWLREKKKALIRVRVSATATMCKILFSDTGPGIAAEHAEAVFEPQVTFKEEGNGMGLPLARDMITRQGGTIEVLKDRRRRGANILLTLPRKRSRATVRRG